ncbi:MAG: alpha/beta hydrolase [Planctomycetes bacterium]|nr:alpha/beta hydrolase [Planctomycetota bacterium]
MLTRREALTAGAAMFASALPSPLLAASRSGRGERVPVRDGRIRLVDGRWLSYREYGQNTNGPPVFYFHGTPGSRLELALCDAETCKVGTRVFAIDRPGLGRSSYDCNRRILDWPSDVEQLAAALGYADTPFGVIGLSGGGPYAAACAYQIPHRLSHVAIVSGHAPMGACGTCPGNEDSMIELIDRRPRLGKLAFKLIGRRLDRKPDKLVQRISKKWSAEDRKLILCNQKHYCQLIANLRESTRCGPTGLIKDIRLLAGNWGFCVSDISGVPVSIWQGGCDPIVTPSMGNYFHRQIANSELIVDPRAGHVTMFKWHAHEILARFMG